LATTGGYCLSVISDPWLYLVAFAAALIIATITSPAGVSGAVLLLPFQVSVLGPPRIDDPISQPACPRSSGW
jgi:uncharacterized membrane protein YfcA